MKRKGNKKNYPELDKFERKQKKQGHFKDKSSKKRLSIYDEFSDDDLDDYNSAFDEYDD